MVNFDVAEYFDTWEGNKKQKEFNKESRFLEKIIKKYKMKNPKILDLGCGGGLHIKNLLKKGYNIQGIDVSKEQIKKARLNIKSNEVKLFLGNIKKINLKKKYDFVYSIQYALNYSLKNEDMLKTLKNINRHMKPHAILVFELMNPYRYLLKYRNKTWKSKKEILETRFDPQTQIISATEHYIEKKFKKPYKIRLFFPEEINFFLHTTGFKLLRVFGDYNQKRFSENSKMIFCVKKTSKGFDRKL